MTKAKRKPQRRPSADRKAYIPSDAEWYLANLVMEFCIAAERQSLVHINTVLVHASSPHKAYAAAIKLGRQAESTYENTDGRKVKVLFRGLRDLSVIHGPLEHGTELIYSEEIGLTRKEINNLVSPKHELGIFVYHQTNVRRPNYMPQEIADMLRLAGFEGPFDASTPSTTRRAKGSRRRR
jgi:hypothetical protein